MGTADEGNFIELLIANERILTWLDELANIDPSSKRLLPLLREMAAMVTTREAYAEEARKAGTVPKLTALLKRKGVSEDEECLDLISSIIAACSGPMASGDKIKTLYYKGIPVTVKEGALGDGVGAKVWTVAHTLCQEIAENPSIVSGQSIIDIGAGCGPCGLLAAKLGALEVVITDYVDQLLLNLRDALHLNDLSPGSSDAEKEDIDDTWDPEGEDGSECSDLDAFFAAATAEPAKNSTTSWQVGTTSVRFVDWEDSVHYLDNGTTIDNKTEERKAPAALDGASSGSVAPGVPDSRQFDLVIGTDILYEWPMTKSVAAAVAHRLKPGGRVLIINAVRDQKMFEALIENLRKRGLRVGVKQIEPQHEDNGVPPHEQDYEGGFVLIAAEHENSPAKNWHRDDLFIDSTV